MAAEPRIEPAGPVAPIARWSLAKRLGFRFCFVYFGLFSLTTQILGGLLPIPALQFPDLAAKPPVRPMVFWTARHIFGITHQLVYTGSGSGDKTFDWVLAFCVLVLSALVCAVWSIFDRRRGDYIALDKWFRLGLRFVLGSEMLLYGIDKVIPLQMPFPYLAKLVEPYGNFSPMSVLWYSVGASPAYEMFVGSAEVLGGLLVMIPRTALLGALICLADLAEVFTLNMTYDVPVKLFSFQLLLIAVLLVLPETARLMRFFFLNRPVDRSRQPPLFGTSRANRVATVAQIAFAILLLAGNAWGGWKAWYRYGGGRERSPLYGIWNVEELTVDGAPAAGGPKGPIGWRRAIFDVPAIMAFQLTDDSFENYTVSLDVKTGKMALSQGPRSAKYVFAFQRPAPGELTLDGAMYGHRVHAQLHLFDRNKLLLVNRGFHWIQEYPFSR